MYFFDWVVRFVNAIVWCWLTEYLKVADNMIIEILVDLHIIGFILSIINFKWKYTVFFVLRVNFGTDTLLTVILLLTVALIIRKSTVLLVACSTPLISVFIVLLLWTYLYLTQPIIISLVPTPDMVKIICLFSYDYIADYC